MKQFGFTILFIIITYLSNASGFNFETSIPIIKEGLNESHFGYSVAEHQTVDQSWILVGAPLYPTDPIKAKLSVSDQTLGALFKCPLSRNINDCTQVYINLDGDRFQQPKRQMFNWVGGTVKSDGLGSKIVTCAHRYAVAFKGPNNSTGPLRLFGKCYVLSNSFEFERGLIPCLDIEKYFDKSLPNTLIFCQAGTSVVIAPDNNVLIGTPGMVNYVGNALLSNFSLNIPHEKMHTHHTRIYSQTYYSETNLKDEMYQYLGMSVAVGEFLSTETCNAAGAPKLNGTGGVIIQCELYNYSLHGEQSFSGFGYEMTTADVDNDKKKDLIISAPFYFDETLNIGGVVYVYRGMSHLDLGNGTYTLNNNVQKLFGREQTRFGFAMTSLGDIQRDGYDDIAIGAPYEDKGAVYIYVGSEKGIISTPSQIIHAKDIQSGLTTFGYSLSGNIDLDGNGHPDLVVGAFESNKVVLFLSRKVIKINTYIESIDPIKHEKYGCSASPDYNGICFTFKTCFNITNSTIHLDLNHYIEEDTYSKDQKSPRVLDIMDDKKKHVNAKIIAWEPSQIKSLCQDVTVYLRNDIRDVLSPIKFRLNYTLVKNEPKISKDTIPDMKKYLILDHQGSILNFEVAFKKDCGEDNICDSDLQLKAAVDECVRTLGLDGCQIPLREQQPIFITIDLLNNGEPAYQTELFVTHSPSLNYDGYINSNHSIKCNSHNMTLVSCYVSNALKPNQPTRIKLKFKPGNLESDSVKLYFNIFANTTSNETKAQESILLFATIHKMAELSIKGNTKTQLIEEQESKKFEEVIPDVFHNYTIYNDGPWKINVVKIRISWPREITDDATFGKLSTELKTIPQVQRDGQNYNCTIRDDHKIKKRDVSSVDTSKTIDENKNPNQVLSMDCQPGAAKCYTIECNILNLRKKREATISIEARLKSTTFGKMSNINIIKIESNADIIAHDIKQKNTDDDTAKATTILHVNFLAAGTTKSVPLWIIVLTALLGLLIIAIISFMLYACGFFKRNRPDKTHSANLEESPTLVNSSGTELYD